MKTNIKQISTKMVKKTTFRNTKLLTFFLLAIYASSYSQSTYNHGGNFFTNNGVNVVYNNGNAQQPVFAPAGYKWSPVSTPSSTFIGYGGTGNSDLSLADKFVVPNGQIWALNKIEFLGFLTNYNSPLPITGLFVQIWSTDPSINSPILEYGNAQTNILNINSIENYFMYRIGWNLPSTANRIWKFNGNINHQLTAGEYWITWQWLGSGSIIFPEYQSSNGVAKFRNNGWGTLIDSGSNLRSTFPFTLTYNNVLSTNEFNKDNKFEISPNPAKDYCIIKTNNLNIESAAKSVLIYDLKGVLLQQNKFINNQQENRLDTSQLQNGLYIVKIISETDKTIFTKKLIIN